MATAVLDGSIASQLQQAFQDGAGGAGSRSAGETQQLEDQFLNALGTAGQNPNAVQGQIVNGNVVVNNPQAINPVAGTSRVSPVSPVSSTDSNFIIDGLTQVRGVFAERGENLNKIANGGSLTEVDRLINLQIEMANYSLLMDVSSKIAGKTVQSLDTLMR